MTRATEYHPGRPAAEYPGRWVSGTIYGSDGRHHDRGVEGVSTQRPLKGQTPAGRASCWRPHWASYWAYPGWV